MSYPCDCKCEDMSTKYFAMNILLIISISSVYVIGKFCMNFWCKTTDYYDVRGPIATVIRTPMIPLSDILQVNNAERVDEDTIPEASSIDP